MSENNELPDWVAAELADFGVGTDDEIAEREPAPVVAVVGRPNVGKSTLVNRIIGRRAAVVQDVPGVTRDRVTYDAYWNGRRFTIMDTGGWEPNPSGLAANVARQAEHAMWAADVVLFVVDASVGSTGADEDAVRLLRKTKTPVLLIANKVDDERTTADAAALWSLGLGEPWPVSALHGRGSGDLLDAVIEALPNAPRETFGAVGGPRRVALVGRPNVGKSSLLNKLSNEERSVVDSVAGTTVDPVDSIVQVGGEPWLFIDTAGLRRRVKNAEGAEFYASLRTAAAIESAEVGVVLIDASEPISEQDQRVITQVIDSGRALVLAMNKWDLVDEDRRYALDREVERDLIRIPWAQRVNISAFTGRSVDRLAPAMRKALESWDTRIATGKLNSWLSDVVSAHPHPVRSGKQPRILFATQAASRPPRFVVFSTGFLEAPYLRFLERRMREDFGFVGSPIQFSVKERKRRPRK